MGHCFRLLIFLPSSLILPPDGGNFRPFLKSQCFYNFITEFFTEFFDKYYLQYKEILKRKRERGDVFNEKTIFGSLDCTFLIFADRPHVKYRFIGLCPLFHVLQLPLLLSPFCPFCGIRLTYIPTRNLERENYGINLKLRRKNQ